MIKDTCMRYYQMGLLSKKTIFNIVSYMPIFGLTKLDYEEITGEKYIEAAAEFAKNND